MIIAVVGAGGKTTWIRHLAQEYRKQEKKVVITTSTHMHIEEDTNLSDSAEEIIQELEKNGSCMAGRRDPKEPEKMMTLSEKTFCEVRKAADVLLVEADGAKHRLVKVPGEREPVIPKDVDQIYVVTGLQAIGGRIKDVAHREKQVCDCLRRHGMEAGEDTILTAMHVQLLLRDGYLKPLRKQYPKAEIIVHPTGADTLYLKAVAALLKADEDVSKIKEEWFRPQPKMMILGAGHVAYEIAKLAKMLDFYTVVVDDRSEFANRERYPEADEVKCISFDQVEEWIDDSENPYYVIVTRGHAADQFCLEEILKHPYEYIGMIGSRRKVAVCMERLREKGVTKEQCDSIHAPIGLAIGARTPAEIAVSIAAEVIQVKNQTSESTMLRELAAYTGSGVLAVITEKTGSSPRGVGSPMVVCEDRILGTIGGGSIEHAVIEEARDLLKEDTPAILCKTYDLSNRESASLGMICGGENTILMLKI